MLATRPSPSATRAVGILNFLAEHPRQAFKLSDLQRALRLSRTTCHSILLALLEAGYVHRGSDKSYTLGPALVDIGQAASASLSPLQVAQPEMRRLADKYDVICAAVFVEGNEMVVRDRAASVSNLGFSAPRGVRLPMTAPTAAIQFAWSKPSQFEAWFGQLDPRPTKAERRRMEQAIEFVREHRFSLGFIELKGRGAALDRSWKRDDLGRPIFRYATTLEGADKYQAGVLQSWVFDPRGRVAFGLALTGMSEPLRAKEILHRGNDLREACDRITASTGGRWPQGWDESEASEE